MPGNDAREEALSVRSAWDVERVARTGSTNDDLLARVRAAGAAGVIAFSPRILLADAQSAGRGRHGHRWQATAGRSLTFSIAWQPRRVDLAGLSLALGAALADALEPATAPLRIGLKWPNDLWLLDPTSDPSAPAGRKLAGILVETAPLGAARVAVIGIGINIAAQPVADAASGVASVDEIDAAASPDAAFASVAPALVAALERFDADGFAAFAERFAARDLLHGRAVAVDAAGVSGVAAGIAADGALLVDTGKDVVALASGECRLRLAASAEPSC
jgi:BirA family biotin operon repressor/biotin-[acetyl-CoA-carboxylase] ligase